MHQNSHFPPLIKTLRQRKFVWQEMLGIRGIRKKCPLLTLPIANGVTAVNLSPGRAEIVAFLTRKWDKELDYRLVKELWIASGDKIAVRFAYEWHDDAGNWFRSYGNKNWEFTDSGLMKRRIASINDLPITESERRYHWPLGRRPDDHPGLSELGL